jgi:ADP-L-glycero-D-manno-heptose 6-epimerase
VIQANIKACKPKKCGVYNVGTAKARSFQDIVDTLKKELDIARKDEYIPNPFVGQYQFFTQADISLSEEFLGYKPRFSLEEGIKSYIKEIKKIHG